MADKNTETTNGAGKNEGQSPLPLFYEKPLPLDAKAHADWALKQNFGFGFTQGVNAVPINLIEMPQICHFYPIAFSPDGNATPVAILGLRDGENLFIHNDNTWEMATYIPAYIRRYPFIFSEIPGKDQLTLCIDDNQDVIDKGGEQKFFDADGKPSELSNNAQCDFSDIITFNISCGVILFKILSIDGFFDGLNSYHHLICSVTHFIGVAYL